MLSACTGWAVSPCQMAMEESKKINRPGERTRSTSGEPPNAPVPVPGELPVSEKVVHADSREALKRRALPGIQWVLRGEGLSPPQWK